MEESGVYLVQFAVPLAQPHPLVLAVNGVEQPYTVAGQLDTGTFVTGTALLSIPENAALTVRNPADSAEAVTIPRAGTDTSPAANLVIVRIQ